MNIEHRAMTNTNIAHMLDIRSHPAQPRSISFLRQDFIQQEKILNVKNGRGGSYVTCQKALLDLQESRVWRLSEATR